MALGENISPFPAGRIPSEEGFTYSDTPFELPTTHPTLSPTDVASPKGPIPKRRASGTTKLPVLAPNATSPVSTIAGYASPYTSQVPVAPAPKPKKTRLLWTTADEQKLKRLKDDGASWSDLAREFPGRSEGSIRKHWYVDMRYAEFAKHESQTLLQAIQDYEKNKWK